MRAVFASLALVVAAPVTAQDVAGLEDPSVVDLGGVGPDDAQPVRVVLAIDGSGSTNGTAGGVVKMDAARAAAMAFLGGVPQGAEVAMVAFGHRGTNDAAGKAEGCAAIETIAPFGTDAEASVDRVAPAGRTPLADAIIAASGHFVEDETPGAQVVYVI